MKSLSFLIWLRDEVGVIHHSKERDRLAPPSNGELRRWLKKSCVLINGEFVSTESEIEFPITNLVLFPKNDKMRCTII